MLNPLTVSTCQTLMDVVKQQATAFPFVVALDGGSGSGKSTLSACLADHMDAVVIPCDDFLAAGIPDAYWLSCSPQEKVDKVIDWQRIYHEALAPLLRGDIARWYAFDFEAGLSEDGTYPMQTTYTTRGPKPIIVLDGIYSARSELSEWVDLTVLVDVPVAVRHERLSQREDPEFLRDWHQRWDVAEAYYFTEVKPPASFDLVITNS